MTAAEEDRAARLAAEMAGHPPVVLELSPMDALSIIGQLQLAARHPSNAGSTVILARAVIARIVDAYAAGGPSEHLERLVLEGDRPSYDAAAPRRAIADAELVPPHIRARMQELVDAPPSPIAKLFGIDVEVDESMPPDVVEVRGETTTRIRGWSPPAPTRADVVRPAGLVWSGIRVDEMDRLYEVLDASHEACPVPLEDGEIIGDPATGRVFVWSRADFDRLAELSRRLHDARRRGLPYAARPVAGRSEHVQLARVVELLGINAESVAIARAIEAGD